jgi:hypothetical protein
MIKATSPRLKQMSPSARLRSKYNSPRNRKVDPTTVVVGATSTLVSMVFLFSLGVAIALAAFLRRNPQCFDPTWHIMDDHGAGWMPVELTLHNHHNNIINNQQQLRTEQ